MTTFYTEAAQSTAADIRNSNYQELKGRVHQELRDRTVAMFVDTLPQGVWQLAYDLRAEVPGQFHALPLLAQAMYVPEIRANSAEIRIEVEDRKPEVTHRFRRAVVEGGGK